MSRITIADVEYIAELARLRLSQADEERLVHELGEVLEYMEKLNSLDTSNVEPMMHALPMQNVFREDEVGASLTREQALANAPKHDDEYFLAPKILDMDEA